MKWYYAKSSSESSQHWPERNFPGSHVCPPSFRDGALGRLSGSRQNLPESPGGAFPDRHFLVFSAGLPPDGEGGTLCPAHAPGLVYFFGPEEVSTLFREWIMRQQHEFAVEVQRRPYMPAHVFTKHDIENQGCGFYFWCIFGFGGGRDFIIGLGSEPIYIGIVDKYAI